MSASKVTDIDKEMKEYERRLAKQMLESIGVKVGVIGAAAQQTHDPEVALDAKTEKFLIDEAARGADDGSAAEQLDALRNKDAANRIKHLFKPGPTMAEIGGFHEFGLGNNPERSWLRGYVDENEVNLLKKIKRVAEQVAQGKISATQGMNLLGLSAVGGIKKRIQASIQPPLAASTLKKKGANKTTPLINSGQFIGSISHEVTTREAAEGAI